MKIYNYSRISENKITEGGISRDNAFYEVFKDRSILIKITNNRMLNMIKLFVLLVTSKKNKIIIHYPSLGVPIFRSDMLCSFFRKIFLKLYKKSVLKNEVIIDIADLPYEQSIDMDRDALIAFLELEREMFFRAQKLIFASSSMRDYAVNKYCLDFEKTIICFNGGNIVDESLDINYIIDFKKLENKLNVVYAGTLNRGRQIEKMVEILKELENINLILMGTEGEWIAEKYSNYKNIYYLGEQDENLAHKIVSQCDLGLIPYDKNRKYYNIAYPTKLSFYITAGIPFLSTDVKEVKSINEKYQFGYIEDILKWDKMIEKMSKEEIEIRKKRIFENQEDFSWWNIFGTVNL